MNDDFDIDARLRAGARAFPAAAAPDSSRLRDVLTTSRRRSRRAQGSVLACGTVAVAGAAGLALRDPGGSQSVEMAAPAATTTTTAAPVDLAQWSDELREFACEPGLVVVEGDPPPHVLYLTPDEIGADLPEDIQVTVDGLQVFVTGTSGPGPDPVASESWSLVVIGSTDGSAPTTGPLEGMHDVLVLLSPLEPGARQLQITAAGVTTAVELPDGVSPASWPVIVSSELPGVLVEWGPLDAVCASEDADPAPPTTVDPAPTTRVPSSVTTPPTTTEIPAPPTTAPSGELAPEDGPAAPTTSTVPQSPDQATTTLVSVPPTTVP